MSKSISLPFLTQANGSRSTKNLSINTDQPCLHKDKLSLNRLSGEQTNRFFMQSREKLNRGSMDHFLGSIGPKAKLEYIHTYRHRLEISDRNKFEKLESSPSAAYLEIIDKQKLNPVPFGIVRNHGKESEVDIHGYCMGDNYAAAFSEGLMHCKSVERVNLKSNRLSEKGSSTILQKLDMRYIKDLCLSENKVGMKSIQRIAEILNDSKSNLRHLSLESTNLNDSAGNLIFDSLLLNNSVTKLNLARNNLTEISAGSLRAMLKSNSTLKRLDLHWNHYTGSGCFMIFEGISKNTSVTEIDLSWNLMVRNLDIVAMQNIAKVLSSQKYLKHLDLSSNYLNEEYCKTLGEGIKTNHELLGIHMSGNDCSVDSCGFIIPNNYVSKIEQGHFMARILGDKRNKSHRSDNCWLCEGWVEVKFFWKEPATEPVCIHLECDEYQPDLMVKEGELYTITRAVPPGKVNFFFSIGLTFVKSNEHKIRRLPDPIEREIVFCGDIRVKLYVSNINQCDAFGLICNTKDPFKTLPRTAKRVYVPPPVEMEKIPWSINVSLFKDYRIDDELTLDDCFEFDWRHSRISNLIKDVKDLECAKNLLRQHYRIIKESYKTLSSYSGSEFPCIGSNSFIELLSQCNIFDSLYAISDFGVNWNSAIVPLVKNQVYNPANALVRYEFMELIVRVANDRYVRTKTISSVSEAIKTLLVDFMLPKLKSLCMDTWRTEKYLNEIVDVTLKSHKQVLDSIYKKFSGRKALPGQRSYMSLEEFRELCTSAGLVNDTLSTRDLDVCFFQAMQTQVDELFKKRHVEMSYVEFLEAICRACDLASISISKVDILVLSPQTLTLQNKIENAAHLLLRLCPQSVQESFVFPTTQTYEKLMFRPKGRLKRTTTINLLEND